MTPTLNWRELALLTEHLKPVIEGLFVDRIVVPERPRFPESYLKGEWAIRLTGRKADHSLLVSIRAKHPYLSLYPGKGPKAASTGTRSPFDLQLGKSLKGAKLVELVTLPRERITVLWFGSPDGGPRLGLVLVMIPASPEAFLVQDGARAWPILARSRVVRDDAKQIREFIPPDGSRAPPDLAVRAELVSSVESFGSAIEKELDSEAFELRRAAAERALRDAIKQARERARINETALREADADQDWKRLGDLLKSALGTELRRTDGSWLVTDYETGEEVRLPSDPKLDARGQVEKFYQLARRRARRIEEARGRMTQFKDAQARFEKALASGPALGDWAALEKFERLAGGGVSIAVPKGEKRAKGWMGRSFVSHDGLAIWVGKSRDENLELTFKHARGNDIWMHVRGRPGAHAVIPLHSGKSAPLETLLDAAHLTIYYSGGESWGTTEVDYTFKKYVKRIKDSTEASYINNKTLLIQPDRTRLKRLLDQQGSAK